MPADRPPPDRERGPSRARSPRAHRFAERTGATDRSERFQERLVRVQRARARRQRRDRLLALAALVVALLVTLVAGGVLGGAAGAFGGAALFVVGWSIWIVVGRLAARRGASAWDWQAERHRLLGDPSRRVQHPPPGGPGLVGRTDDDPDRGR